MKNDCIEYWFLLDLYSYCVSCRILSRVNRKNQEEVKCNKGRETAPRKEYMNVDTLEDIARNMESGVYDFTVNGECSGCGSCCSNYLPLSSKEIKEIHRYIKKHKIKEQKCFVPLVNDAMDLTCPFRSEKEQKCLIYSIRPEICRSFRCDYPRKKIRMKKDTLHKRYQVVEMRKEFFGSEKKI